MCVRVNIASGASGDSVATVKATSSTDATVSATANVKTIGVGPNDALLVDNDDNNPDVQQYYKDALTAANVPFQTWDLKADGLTLPQAFLMDFTKVVWFTGNSYPDPVGPYEDELKGFLDAGGRLLMSGQDILDQAAGTSSFFSDYMHITWDGSRDAERQADERTFTAWPVIRSVTASAPSRSTTASSEQRSRTRSPRTAPPSRRSPTTRSKTDALSYSGGVQGRLPRLPAGGVRRRGRRRPTSSRECSPSSRKGEG